MGNREKVSKYIVRQTALGLPVILYTWYFKGVLKNENEIFLTIQDAIKNLEQMTSEEERDFDSKELVDFLMETFKNSSSVEAGNFIIEKLVFVKNKGKKERKN